jgi:hypothetical protein
MSRDPLSVLRTHARELLPHRPVTMVTAIDVNEVTQIAAERATCGQSLGNSMSDTMVLRAMRAGISRDVKAQ